ncbi:isoleucyl-tRNA synthetase-like protein [Lophiotrema nucula]|uniref:Isoleucine--tRNA ligase, mitochondrial n=1 Tax=Lophiotrema nucula TaxID=690887 RepID=A0A6A5YUI7_9PLEO|nr:isoleucyl-tRNA synthetase-like protein [Lophiotrema nucula]
MVAPTRLLRASWSSTLRLPKSSFPARPSPAANAEYLRRCTDELYTWQQSSRSTPDADGQLPEAFTLHDGPPYANGPLHIGHALNKITKDIICRFQVGQGKKVSYIPGWDCHGLPIEIKALQAQKKDANTDPVSVREAARELATKTVEEQKKGFKEWAVMGDWDNAYKTMQPAFEIRQLDVFKRMFEKGLIYRQFKPVYWSPSSRTALAEAELEYDENHRSLAAFVRFPVELSELLKKDTLSGLQGPLNIAIWTTTPWTLPANKAIAVHRDMQYSVVQDAEKGNELTLVASSRVAYYQDVLGRDLKEVLASVAGSDLAGNLTYENPFQRANGRQTVIHADFVSDASGTGLVHMAPGHGMDDYHVCSALDIQAFAPIDDAGAFTKEAFPEQPEVLEGMLVGNKGEKSATKAVTNYLEIQDLLRATQTYRHKYPIDWRTKQPVVVRATEQWFAGVDKIKDHAMEAMESVEFIPEAGRARLESFIQGRSQWCISRQRAWGVPIPALYRVDEGRYEATMDSKVIQNAIEVIKEHGTDAWWTDAPDDAKWVPKHLSGSYVRGRDTMDVWFDSGTSWTLLPSKRDQPVADVYLEGTDQHRGWFQSSLLTHVAAQSIEALGAKAPYKTLVTHGFTLDSDGRKMSKSLGNVISPSQITSGELLPPLKRKKQKGAKKEQGKDITPAYDAMGSDALRLWVASSDYTKDVTIGQPVLQAVNQALHKYRVTLKWLLGIFSLPSTQPAFTSFDKLRITYPMDPAHSALYTDKLALHRLSQVSKEVHEYYAKYEFYKGVNAINKFINLDLSAFYFETLKDRIYTGTEADCQHLQNILGVIFYELLQMLSPISPLLVEEAWDHVPQQLRESSVHPARAHWLPLQFKAHESPMLLDKYVLYVDRLGSAIKTAQERLRTEKKLGSGLECDVVLGIPEDSMGSAFATEFLNPVYGNEGQELSSLFVVSGFEISIVSDVEKKIEALAMEKDAWWAEERLSIIGNEFRVLVHRPTNHKCPRCWRFVATYEGDLCTRCHDVVQVAEGSESATAVSST